MSLTTWSPSRDRNKYCGIRRRSTNLFKGFSLCYCDAIYRRVLLFACTLSYLPLYFFLSQMDDDDVRDIGKHDFPSILHHPMGVMFTTGFSPLLEDASTVCRSKKVSLYVRTDFLENCFQSRNVVLFWVSKFAVFRDLFLRYRNFCLSFGSL